MLCTSANTLCVFNSSQYNHTNVCAEYSVKQLKTYVEIGLCLIALTYAYYNCIAKIFFQGPTDLFQMLNLNNTKNLNILSFITNTLCVQDSLATCPALFHLQF